MAARITRVFLIVSLLAGMGAHWVALQSYAWAGMLVSRASSGGLAQAVASTFDGEHPCHMCLTVEEGTRSSREQAPRASFAKVDFIQASRTPAPLFLEAYDHEEFPSARRLAAVAAFEPPPPRSLHA